MSGYKIVELIVLHPAVNLLMASLQNCADSLIHLNEDLVKLANKRIQMKMAIPFLSLGSNAGIGWFRDVLQMARYRPSTL